MPVPNESPSPLRLQLLRAAQLHLADGSAHALSGRDAALLALLAVDGPLPRGRVAALLWPDADSQRARSSLRQRLFRLRQRAGRDVVVAGEVLSLADGVQVDVAAWPLLQQDAAALQGELLAGVPCDDDELGRWIEAARESWRAQRREALAEAASRHEGEGHVATALPFAERLVADEPLLEHAQRRVMRLHFLRGDSAAALAVFEALRSTMQRELGASPGAETLALMRQITAGTAPSAHAPRPAPVLRAPRLVGRERQWAALTQAWAAMRPALLVGEPGIGKSRLLADFVQGQPGTVSLQGRIGDAAVPYALLARLVRAVLTASGRAAAELPLPDAAREQLALVAVDFGRPSSGSRIDALRLQQAVHHLIVASAVKALAIDDLHHADDASLDLLPSLWAPGAMALRLLLAVRAAEMPRQLRPVGDDDGEPVLHTITLTLLDTGEVAELLAALALPGLDGARWAEPLHRHTHGNPLFILETLRALLQPGDALPAPTALPLPPRVGQVIEQRLARLSERGLHLARVAALAGQDFSLELAATLIECPLLALSEPWRELEAAQVLHDGAFAHDLVLEATRRSVPPPIAQALHGRIATFLAARQVPPSRLAGHWAAAEAWAQAAIAWSEAAAAAYVAVRLDESVACREAAIDCYLRAGDHETANDQSVHNVAALIQASSGERALAAGQRGLAIAVTPLQRANALVMLSHVQVWLMHYEDSLTSSREAFALAATLADAELRCHTACRLAAALGHLGRGAEALPVMAAVRELALSAVPIGLRCQFLGELGNVQMLSDAFDDAAASYTLCIETALAAQEVLLARQALHLLAVLQWQQGRLDACERSILTAIGLRGDGRSEDGISRNEAMQLGAVRTAQGRYSEAIELLSGAVEGFRREGPVARAILAENHLAQVWLDLGQPARAHQQLFTKATGQPAFIVCARTMLAVRVATAMSSPAPPEALDTLRRYAAQTDLRTTQRLLATLELARHEAPADGLRRCFSVQAEAEAKHCDGVAAHARVAVIRQWLAARGMKDPPPEALATPGPAHAIDLYPPEAARLRALAHAAAGADAERARVMQAAIAWIDATRAHVPAAFIDSFLRRNPVNAALRSAGG